VHTYIGDLVVSLVAPDGSTYPLHSRSGGSTDNIDQTYTVNLSPARPPTAPGRCGSRTPPPDTGYINSWTLSLTPPQPLAAIRSNRQEYAACGPPSA
jgi:subtilisin-like proprotein convertase family protein